MIQLLQEPVAHSFTRNPIIYRWRAVDNGGLPYRAYGVQSEIRITDNDALTGDYILKDGDVITLTWTEPDGTSKNYSFTALDAYDGGSNKLPTANSGIIFASATDYWNTVRDIMAANSQVSPLFLFRTSNEGSYQSYVAEAREVSDEWIVSFSLAVATMPYTVVDTIATTPSSLPENYRIVWELFFEPSYRASGFVRISQGEAFVNKDSEASLDLSEMLRAAAEDNLGDPSVPAYATTAPILADNTRRYYLRYREAYDDQVSPSWTVSTLKLALHGGISQALYAQDNDWLGGRDADTSFLTWKPDHKTVATTQKEYLAWYNYTGGTTSVVLEYIGTNVDGTTTASSYLYASQEVSARANETILFPVGPTELGQAGDTNIAYYTVRVVDRASDYAGGSPTYLSPPRSYQVDRKQYESVRYLQYLNGFGCPETVRCLGYFTNDLEVEREESARTLSPGYSSTAKQVRQHNENWTNFFTYRTSYLPRLEVDSLQELFISGKAYEIFADGYIPLQLVGSTMPVTETRQLLHSVTLSTKPALLARNYSNVLLAQPEANDLWLVHDNTGYWLTIFGQRWEQV